MPMYAEGFDNALPFPVGYNGTRHHPAGTCERADMKSELKDFLRRSGAFAVGIASPHKGYEKAEPGYSPLEVWPRCRSVVVFAVAMSPDTNNTYMGPYAPHRGNCPLGPVPGSFQSEDYAMNRLARQMTAPVIIAAHAFLEHKGFSSTFRTVQCKLSGYLAGLGVYGKSGILINPLLGNRMCISAIMTDAELEPDSPLENFEPCANCSICIDSCPADALDRSLEYPESWNRDICVSKRREIAEKGSYCHNCFALCPAGKIADSSLVVKKVMKPISQGAT